MNDAIIHLWLIYIDFIEVAILIFGDETLEYKKINTSLSKMFYYLLYLLILLPIIIIVAYWHVQKYLTH